MSVGLPTKEIKKIPMTKLAGNGMAGNKHSETANVSRGTGKESTSSVITQTRLEWWRTTILYMMLLRIIIVMILFVTCCGLCV